MKDGQLESYNPVDEVLPRIQPSPKAKAFSRYTHPDDSENLHRNRRERKRILLTEYCNCIKTLVDEGFLASKVRLITEVNRGRVVKVQEQNTIWTQPISE